MAEVSRTKKIDMGPDELWALVGDFHGMHKWVGIEPSESLDGGTRRKLQMGPGAAIIERLLEEGERSYTYTIDEGPLPLKDYRSTLSVEPADGGGSVLSWVGTFEPAEGADEAAAVQIVEMVYDGGLQALDRTLSS